VRRGGEGSLAKRLEREREKGTRGQSQSDWNGKRDNRLRRLELVTNWDSICKKCVWEMRSTVTDLGLGILKSCHTGQKI
jgi:hypothetical protein